MLGMAFPDESFHIVFEKDGRAQVGNVRRGEEKVADHGVELFCFREPLQLPPHPGRFIAADR